VSQIEIRYRQSTLSEGKAGAVHGGDRLPWVRLGRGSNHDPLTSIAWQAHVYGDARHQLPEACRVLGIELHVFPWKRAMKRVGLARGALYLVRPDGYVALADPQGNPERLTAYLTSRVQRR
jgi:hypothetical protein